jgi:hypothetical protein
MRSLVLVIPTAASHPYAGRQLIGRQGEVTFEEYNAIREHFKASAIPIGTTIDLASSSLGEDDDGPQP